jgi:glutamate formiminotransferase/formiminotetrahydrofolate cyclodeaminase
MTFDLERYLDRLASAHPTPGGGSAAAVVGALGAALVAMVARVTRGSARHAGAHAACDALAADADDIRERFLLAGTDDEAAFEAYMAAVALPKISDEQKHVRRNAMQRALVGAAEAPLHSAILAAECAELAARARDLGNTELSSDVDCAFRFARAALDAAAANVRINHRHLDDAETVAAQSARLASSFERYSLAAGSLEASSTLVI